LTPDENLGGVIQFLIEAFQGGQFFAVGALILMILVWSSSRIFKIPSKWLPVLTAACGMLSSLAVELGKADVLIGAAIYKGLLTSGSAAIFWSMLGKNILPREKKEDPK